MKLIYKLFQSELLMFKYFSKNHYNNQTFQKGVCAQLLIIHLSKKLHLGIHKFFCVHEFFLKYKFFYIKMIVFEHSRE